MRVELTTNLKRSTNNLISPNWSMPSWMRSLIVQSCCLHKSHPLQGIVRRKKNPEPQSGGQPECCQAPKFPRMSSQSQAANKITQSWWERSLRSHKAFKVHDGFWPGIFIILYLCQCPSPLGIPNQFAFGALRILLQRITQCQNRAPIGSHGIP